MVMEDIALQTKRSTLTLQGILKLYGIPKSTYHGWAGSHIARDPAPRKNFRAPLPEEVQAVLDYRKHHSEVGYRKFTHMMNDSGTAYLSEPAVFKLLSEHKLLSRWDRADNGDTDKEYRDKPKYVHHHWHIDIAYIKIRGVFYFLVMVLDGYSRYLLGWDLMTDMLSSSVEAFVLKVKEKYPHATPKMIHDNGAQFISRDFKSLVTRLNIQQVFTRRNHPQTNGKAERWVGLVKQEAIRPNSPTSYQEAWQVLEEYAYLYTHQRLHAGINFLRPADVFFGRDKEILAERAKRVLVAKKVRRELNKQRKSSIV
jgi:transposase InsO family protein